MTEADIVNLYDDSNYSPKNHQKLIRIKKLKF